MSEELRGDLERSAESLGKLALVYPPIPCDFDDLAEHFDYIDFSSPDAIARILPDDTDVAHAAQQASDLGAGSFFLFDLPGGRRLLIGTVWVAGAEYEFLIAEFGEDAAEKPTDLAQLIADADPRAVLIATLKDRAPQLLTGTAAVVTALYAARRLRRSRAS